jgi:hypothetical protein
VCSTSLHFMFNPDHAIIVRFLFIQSIQCIEFPTSLANSVHTYESSSGLPHMAPPGTLVVSTPPGVVSSHKQRDAGGHQQRQLDELRLGRVFDTFDRDSDGVITPAELSGALGRLDRPQPRCASSASWARRRAGCRR